MPVVRPADKCRRCLAMMVPVQQLRDDLQVHNSNTPPALKLCIGPTDLPRKSHMQRQQRRVLAGHHRLQLFRL